MSENVLKVNQENYEETIKEGVILLDFWAHWCGPCRMITPIIDELGEDFKGKAKICKINTDEEQQLAIQYGIRSIPTILIIKNGVTVDSFVGAQSKTTLSNAIIEALK